MERNKRQRESLRDRENDRQTNGRVGSVRLRKVTKPLTLACLCLFPRSPAMRKDVCVGWGSLIYVTYNASAKEKARHEKERDSHRRERTERQTKDTSFCAWQRSDSRPALPLSPSIHPSFSPMLSFITRPASSCSYVSHHSSSVFLRLSQCSFCCWCLPLPAPSNKNGSDLSRVGLLFLLGCLFLLFFSLVLMTCIR